MLTFLLGIAKYGVLLLFGVYTSATFAGIRISRRNGLILLLFSFINIVIQASCYAVYGIEGTEKLYPLISHLPLVLLLILVFKRRLLTSLFAVTSAYLCCQFSAWIGILVFSVVNSKAAMSIAQILMLLLMSTLIYKFIASSITAILLKPRKAILIFSFPVFSYYVFDYLTTVYSNMLYSDSKLIVEFPPFAFCISYLMFCVIYFKEYEEKKEIQSQNQLIEIQSAQSKKEIETLRHTEGELARLRHDMRHFLTNIEALLQNHDSERAIEYIHELIAAADHTALMKYCGNNLVNIILSYYDNRMQERGIQLQATVKLSAELPCSDTDFTSILSNGLENALHAVSDMEDGNRIVVLHLRMVENKMLLSIKNPFKTAPHIVDGLPVTDREGHGLGTQSICYVTEKLKGNCQFLVQEGQFVLRVIL